MHAVLTLAVRLCRFLNRNPVRTVMWLAVATVACASKPEYRTQAVMPLTRDEVGTVVEPYVAQLGFTVASLHRDASCQHFRTACVTIVARKFWDGRDADGEHVLELYVHPGTSQDFGYDIVIVAYTERRGPDGRTRTDPLPELIADVDHLVEALESLGSP